MSYDRDPARWTSSPEEAPEILRGAFSAGRNEGPNRAQMRSLAVKLAAASAGGAVAVGTAKAASAGNAIAGAASWSVTKIASVVALAGSVVTGAVVWQQSGQPAETTARSEQVQLPIEAAPHEASALNAGPEVAVPERRPAAEPRSAETPVGSEATTPLPTAEPAGAPTQAESAAAHGAAVPGSGEPVIQAMAPVVTAAPTVDALPARPATPARPAKPTAGRKAAAPSRTTSSAKRASSRFTSGASSVVPAAEAPSTTRAATAQARVRVLSGGEVVEQPSELSLLHRAQAALRGRPREAFKLTQQHRHLYPEGEFAQERDALAIQALMQAGESDMARELAKAFIRSYPSSPHAHRFREAMELR